jgi:type II secretory pathway component GspD/PulD (secretin)
MKNYLKIGFLLAPLAIMGFTPALAQNASEDFYRQWVDYRDGEISVVFDQTPVDFVLYAIHAKTGFQIVIPASSETKFVNLRLERQPLESAVRSVISTIGFTNFAMLYDENGQPHRAVVLGVQPLPLVSASLKRPDSIAAPITIEEIDKLQQDLDRWNDLNEEERDRIEERLRNSPPSDEREFLVREYGRQILGLK